jgi:hypothetical protein
MGEPRFSHLTKFAQPDSFSAILSMQTHPSAKSTASAPPATSFFVFVLVCALLAFALFI